MDSTELQGCIAGILWCMDTSDEDCGIKTLKELMSLLSKNCWLKDTLTGVGEKRFEVVKPIEEV